MKQKDMELLELNVYFNKLNASENHLTCIHGDDVLTSCGSKEVGVLEGRLAIASLVVGT